uniref:Movement protein n=1 Tax=Carnation mottle virus TaxID=11986 RepID=Q99A07_CARMV|nr:movement protein [Carnation mottle virus]
MDIEPEVPVVGKQMLTGNRGKQKTRRSGGQDAIRKPASDNANGGNWVNVADKIEVHIHFNF